VWYATNDGKSCTRLTTALLGANGIGLSPDGKYLYVALTLQPHVIRWEIESPGDLLYHHTI
jgi:gluconolactonase